MALSTLKDLYVQQLKDLYSAEQQLIKALPKMAKAAHSPGLKHALEVHLDQTKEQRERLDKIFKSMGAGKPRGVYCEAMEGMIEEGEEILGSDGDPAVIDAGIIASAQREEHYEIAGYGTARTFAQQLGFDDAAELLQQTLEEEGQADKTLTQVAESEVNPQAAQASGQKAKGQAFKEPQAEEPEMKMDEEEDEEQW